MTDPLSPRNPRLQRVRRLSTDRRERRRDGRFVVEGPTLVGEAVAAGLAIEALYAEPGAAVPEAVDPRVVWRVQPGALDRVGDVVAAQGVLAVVELPAGVRAVEESPPRLAGLVLVLWDLADPGNVGTLVRAAHAAGATAVVATSRTADLWSPKVVRASAGSLFHLAVHELVDPLAAARRSQVRVVAAVARGGVDHDRCDLTGDVALVVGNEAHGLPPEVVAAADQAVTIAHAGGAESLNAAMAGTVLLFESLRQRRTQVSDAPDTDWTSPTPDDKVPQE